MAVIDISKVIAFITEDMDVLQKSQYIRELFKSLPSDAQVELMIGLQYVMVSQLRADRDKALAELEQIAQDE